MELSRKSFLDLSWATLAGLAIPVRAQGQERNVVATEEESWDEVSPITEAGGESLGAIREEFTGDKGDKLISEIRSYKLPRNTSFPGSVPVVISSRVYRPEIPLKQQMKIMGGPMLFFVPEHGDMAQVQAKYDWTFNFQGLSLGVVAHGERRNIWEHDYYYQGRYLQKHHLFDPSGVSVDRRGAVAGYGNVSIFFTNEEHYVFNSEGVVYETGKSIQFNLGDNSWSSVPIPEHDLKGSVGEIVIARMGDVALVKGLTPEPYSIISQPATRDGQYWRVGRDTMHNTGFLAVTEDTFMGRAISREMAVTVSTGDMRNLETIISGVDGLWGGNTSFFGIRTNSVFPLFLEDTGEMIVGVPVRKPKCDVTIIATVDPFWGRSVEIPLRTEDVVNRPVIRVESEQNG